MSTQPTALPHDDAEIDALQLAFERDADRYVRAKSRDERDSDSAGIPMRGEI